jgi:hypothetical protein
MMLYLKHAVSAAMARSTGAIKHMSFVLASLLSVLSRLLAAALQQLLK